VLISYWCLVVCTSNSILSQLIVVIGQLLKECVISHTEYIALYEMVEAHVSTIFAAFARYQVLY
jgi:hypothetical protein